MTVSRLRVRVASCALLQMVRLWMGGFSVALFWISSMDSEKIREAGSHVYENMCQSTGLRDAREEAVSGLYRLWMGQSPFDINICAHRW